MKINLRLFGAFRKCSKDGFLKFEFSDSLTVKEFKEILSVHLRKQLQSQREAELVGDSALANENEVLLDHFLIHQSCELAILPPVCGG